MPDSFENVIGKISALHVGSVEAVSPDRIDVVLDLNAPQATSLNTGVPSGFPRINGFLLVWNEVGAVVGLITWIGIERSPYPKRTGLRDFGLVDLPFPLRKVSLTPLGTLVSGKPSDEGEAGFQLRRGVTAFPCVGDAVLLPTRGQLRAIVEAGDARDRRVFIGTSPLAESARITIDPDKLFGRHLAVLGNTGSGKSCSVAGMIRWCLDAAGSTIGDDGFANARFLILDPNGEYYRALRDLKPGVRLFRVPQFAEEGGGEKPLRVPAWLWNSHEWSAFAAARPGSQRPLLLKGLRDMRNRMPDAEAAEAARNARLSGELTAWRFLVQTFINEGATAYVKFPKTKQCWATLALFKQETDRLLEDVPPDAREALSTLGSTLEKDLGEHLEVSSSRFQDFKPWGISTFESLRDCIDAVLKLLPSPSTSVEFTEDTPVPFPVGDFPDFLDTLALVEGGGSAAQFMSWLTMRIRSLIQDKRLGPIIDTAEPTLQEWLSDYIGGVDAENGQVAILDLSLVSSDVIHTVIAVVSRLVFEATQRYVRLHPEGKPLPTVLVLEEAHTFVRRGSDADQENLGPADICRRTFERIAREGRKFGLGLVLSSQRPSELSPTVLAQCNSFLLHRLVNDRDQDLVRRLVPDSLGKLLSELPSLPSGRAILLGWASPIPRIVDITELPKKQQPRSDDPDFWAVWTRSVPREVDWDAIAKDWTTG